MFCAKCGHQINSNLNFCNICGTKVSKNGQENDVRSFPFKSLVTVLGFVALGGLGILIGLLSELLNKGVAHEAVAIIAIFYLMTLTIICFSITRLMSKLIEVNKQEKQEENIPYLPPAKISAPNTAQLIEKSYQPISVTEDTTRTMNKILIEK